MTKLHDNYAYIYSDEIEKITYLPDTWVISEGQPMEPPPTITKNGDQFLICFRGGRHKSKSVAEKFNGRSGGDGHMFSPFTMNDRKPAELNFCFGLKIHWKTGETVDVYLGQGSTMSRNNWWLGSSYITSGNGTAAIKTREGDLGITGYDKRANASGSTDDVEMLVSIPPQLVWIIKEVGQKVAEEVAKLITANVNSFKITK